MSTTISSRLDETPEQAYSAGVARSEPVGRAQRRAGAARRPDPRPELADEVKALLPDELIDELMAKVKTEGIELLGEGGLIAQFSKRILERALDEELTDELGYELVGHRLELYAVPRRGNEKPGRE